MDEKLQITDSGPADGVTQILQLTGPIVISGLFEFQSRVRGSSATNLILDMSRVPYVDSSAVGVLVGVYVSRQKHERKLLLVGVNPRVRTILQVTQVERFFEFADRVPDSAAGA